MTTAGARGGRGRSAVAAAVLVLVLVGGAVAVVALGGGGEDGTGPGGTVALERFLGRMGADVSSAEQPPERGVFVLLADFRDEEQAASVLSWVEGGGRLVLAHPYAATASAVGVEPGGPIGRSVLGPGCVAPEAAGVDRLTVSATDSGLELPPEAVGCFAAGGDPFLGVVPHGHGTVVALGGASPLTNELLLQTGNARMALRAFAPAEGCPAGTPVCGPVVFGPPAPAGFGQALGLWASLPARAKVVAAGLALAFVVFALARGRRLGRPVVEEPLTVIPASQLAHAASGLYRNARADAHAGTLLRDAAAWRISRRLGFPTADAGEVRRLLEADGRLGGAPGILGAPPPRDDTELLELGEGLARLEAAAVEELR
jgi:hypothetical protein